MKTEYKATFTGAKAWCAAFGIVAAAAVVTYVVVGAKK